jgi:hypothetical protein
MGDRGERQGGPVKDGGAKSLWKLFPKLLLLLDAKRGKAQASTDAEGAGAEER